MPAEFASFAFISTLAAVINGLGIIRWLNSLADYLRKRDSMTIEYYWVYTLAAVFQFVLHILLWWSFWSVRGDVNLNFFTYLYLLTGPIMLFIGSAFLANMFDEDRVNLRQHYYGARPVYSTVLVLSWTWALMIAPIFRGYFVDHSPIFAMFLVVAIAQRVTDYSLVHRIAAIINWLLLLTFVTLFGLELGGLQPKLDLFD
jgi:hypothetical protein